MGRKAVKEYNEKTMTKAQVNSLITSALRRASMYWKPKSKCLSNARVSRGMYKCEKCKKIQPGTLPPLPGKKKKTKNILADHISPIVNPREGFVSWDSWIERCFVEIEGFQALCKKCHDGKSKKEREIAKGSKKAI